MSIDEQAAAKRAKLAARFGGDEPAGEAGAVSFGFGAPPGGADARAACGTNSKIINSSTTVAPIVARKPVVAAKSYVCEASEALKFYMCDVKAVESFAKGACGVVEDGFEPEFTHQVFREDESIFGYAGLSMSMYVCKRSLKALLKIDYEDKIESAMNPADPVREQLGEWYEEHMYVDEGRFKAEADMSTPCAGGTLISESEKDGVVTKLTAYELWTNAEARAWHDAMEALAVFYIEAFSKIVDDDPRWTLLVATRHHADGSWETAGYTTVYRYYAYPDSERARLSQIVVLPPYQRQGLGAQLLEAVRKLAIDRSMRDLTIEDPTDQLQRLRDVLDVKACLTTPDLWTKVQHAAVKAAHATTEDERRNALMCTAEIYTIAASKLKICKKQMRRVWEALLFIFAKRSNAPENSPVADAFKELIIRRLKAMYVSNSDKDAGTKRIYAIGANDFVMTKARGKGGEAPQMEDPEEGQPDVTEVLGELFGECVGNLAFLHAQCKNILAAA